MPPVPLSDIDLNLLVVLDVLLEECHITRSAKRLGRTQSAISHALARLRTQLGDPLLVRVAGRMEMTPRAIGIQQKLRPLLHQLRRVLDKPAPWDPTSSRRTFSLIAPDFTCLAFPRIYGELTSVAPGCSLELLPVKPTMFRDVAGGQSDLAFFRTLDPAAEVLPSHLCTLENAVFMRRGHPAFSRWGLDAWLEYPHIRIRVVGGDSPVDDATSQRDLKRQLGPVVTNFLMIPHLLMGSDLLFTGPYGILSSLMSRFDLVAAPCPLAIDDLELSLYVSEQAAEDPALVWFQELIRQSLIVTFDQTPNVSHQMPLENK